MTTNQIAKAKPRPMLPERLEFPKQSLGLQVAFRDAEYWTRGPDPEVFFADRLPPSAVLAEARALLEMFDQALLAAPSDLIAAWLRPVGAAVRNPPAATDFDIRVSAIATLGKMLPFGVMTKATQREAIANWAFWPSAADVIALIREDVRELQEHRSDVAKIAKVRHLDELPAARAAHEARVRREGRDAYPSDVMRLRPMTGGFD